MSSISPTRYLLIVLRSMLAFCWAGAAAAAGVIALSTSPTPPLQLDPVLALLSCFTSSLAGATTLAIRVNNLLMAEASKPMVKPWLFALSHMLGSWLAGLAGFLVGRVNIWDPWNSLLIVLLLSFMGAKGLELLAEKYLPVIGTPKEAP